MKTYHVSWEIEVDAESHEEAAKRALEIQRNPCSSATVFDVIGDGEEELTRVDLLAIEEGELDDKA